MKSKSSAWRNKRPADKENVVGHVLGRWSDAEKKLTRNAFNLALKEMVKFLETSQFQNVSFSVTQPE